MRPRPDTTRHRNGFTLVEIMFVLGVSATLAGIAVAQTTVTLDRSRALGATRFLAGRMGLARAQAVARSATVALRFEEGPDGVTFATYQDGNGNGVRTADIQAGVDRMTEAPMSLADLYPGVAIALDAVSGTGGPVQIGSSRLLSFTSLGTATSGTIYVRGRDGSQYAVRVLGATAKTRVLRFDASSGSLVDLLF